MITHVETRHSQVDNEIIKFSQRSKRDLIDPNLLITSAVRDKTEGYLGVDPSLSCLGYFFYSKERNEFVSGHLKPNTKGSDRLKEITRMVSEILVTLKPKSIYLENYSYDSPFKAHDLGELGGLLRMIFDEYVSLHGDTKFVKISPSSVKLLFAGNGKASKKEMLVAAKNVFGVDLSSEDEADAAGLCYAALLDYIPEAKVKKPKKKKEVSLDEATEKKPKRSRKNASRGKEKV